MVSMSITAILVRNSTSMAFPMTLPAPSMVATTDTLDAFPSTTPRSLRTTQAEQRLASRWPVRQRERRIWDLQMRNARRSKHQGLRSDHTLRHWISSFETAARHTSQFMEAGKSATSKSRNPTGLQFLVTEVVANYFVNFRNRNPGDGYRLSKVDFANGQPVSASDDPDAEERLMWNTDNSKCPSGCFRPAGLTFDKDGRLFMTSDSTGELYVVTGV